MEEQIIVKQEMVAVITHLRDLLAGLDNFKTHIETTGTSVYSRGLYSIVCRKQIMLQQRLEGFREAFCLYVDNLPQLPHPETIDPPSCASRVNLDTEIDSDETVISQIALEVYDSEDDSWDECFDYDLDD